MAHIKKSVLLIFSLMFFMDLSGQNAQEIPYRPPNKDFNDFQDRLEGATSQKSMRLAQKGLNKFEESYERYWLLYHQLSFQYASLGDYKACLEVLQQGQKEGLFYFRNGFPDYPEYRKELKKLEGYQEFLSQNELLKKTASENSKMEFMVQVPDGYNKEKAYPLFVVVHGGMGSIQNLQQIYSQSPLLRNEFIVAYFQGSELAGSHSRVFSQKVWEKGLAEGIEKIVSRYTIDTDKVVLGGQSAGGIQALTMGVKNIISVKGIVLFFPLVPKDLLEADYLESGKGGLKIAIISGENDWAIKRQKELAYSLDKYSIPNRLLIFPDLGHQFPEDYAHHLDQSLRYVLNKE